MTANAPQPFLTPAQRWGLAEAARRVGLRIWRCEHIWVVDAICFDDCDRLGKTGDEFNDHCQIVRAKIKAIWDRFLGAIWLNDPIAISEEWVKATFYHSAWFGLRSRWIPSEETATWRGELNPFREMASAATMLRMTRRTALDEIASENDRLEAAAWAIRALDSLDGCRSGLGFDPREWGFSPDGRYIPHTEIKTWLADWIAENEREQTA